MTHRIATASVSIATTPIFVLDAEALQTPNAFIITEPTVDAEETGEAYRPRTLESRSRRAKRLAGRR